MPGGVGVGRVEEVDPGLDSLADNRHAVMLGKRPCLAAPPRVPEAVRAQAEPGYLQAGRAQRSILHLDMVATCMAVARPRRCVAYTDRPRGNGTAERWN